RTLDVHIRKVRSKLGDAGSYIETVRGVGYRFKV
ncbi:MAG: winged helix-turn-helix domain-containing protein, partial [Lachnospiraceae bacterium]|nr:winged helix-turn-helix domain-containing protein [Lachnospiraceae bacterium]